MAPSPSRGARIAALTIACAGMLAVAGCVERRMTIRTIPAGAMVVVNGEEIGPSPASKSFTYYGDRDVQLYLEGYAPKRVIQPLPAPWWDNMLTEFFSENLVPVTLHDEHEFVYTLEPQTKPPTPELLNRADDLRRRGQQPPKPRPKGFLAWLGFSQ